MDTPAGRRVERTHFTSLELALAPEQIQWDNVPFGTPVVVRQSGIPPFLQIMPLQSHSKVTNNWKRTENDLVLGLQQ